MGRSKSNEIAPNPPPARMRRLTDPLYDTDVPGLVPGTTRVYYKPYGQPVPASKTRLSRRYYFTYCGDCRRVLLHKNGRMAEYPYNLKHAKLCKRPGKHPHCSHFRARKGKGVVARVHGG